MRIYTPAAVAAIAALAASASADVLFNNFGPGDAHVGNAGWTLMNGAVLQVHLEQAADFTVAGGSYFFDSVDLAVGHLFGPNLLHVYLHADAGGAPGAVLETVTIIDQLLELPNDPNINNPPVTATFSGTTVLDDGATYWISLSSDFSVPDSWLAWNESLADTARRAHREDGGPWQVFDNNFDRRGAFRINGSPVPEPATASLLLAIGGTLLLRRRS